MKYCRYCAFCILGDWYYCNYKDKELKRVDRTTNCQYFILSKLGDVETGKQYKPRVKANRSDLEQISFDDLEVL